MNSTLTETHQKDTSSVSNSTIQRDSVIIERVIEKTLPAQIVKVSFTRQQLDSLYSVLIHANGGKLSYGEDRARVSLYLDSLGRLVVACNAMEEKYNQIIRTERVSSKEKSETITRLITENKTLRSELFELRKSPWQQFISTLDHYATHLCVTAILIAFVMVGYKVFKK